jgi:acyl-CoA reductase-like NAD-dependent aldehyde dehydrogenase
VLCDGVKCAYRLITTQFGTALLASQVCATPATLDNPSPHADYVKLENFGPLRSLIKYGTIDEAIEIANSTDYGLGGSVWGRDPAELDAVAHRMEAGTVWINQHLVINPNVPVRR